MKKLAIAGTVVSPWQPHPFVNRIGCWSRKARKNGCGWKSLMLFS